MFKIDSLSRTQKAVFCVLLASWAVFAVDFIYRTSHVSIDGIRYFTIFDDGMIGMRYAKNFVEHHGLVWNVGERVEGFTDPLWILLMIVAISLFGLHLAPLAVQIVGWFICLATFLVYSRCGMRTRATGIAVLTGLALLVFSYPISYWALAGMEACAVCLLVTIALSAQYSYEQGSANNPLLLHACLMAIAYGLRPDGWLAFTPLFLACWYDAIKQKKYSGAIWAPAIVVSAFALVLTARFMYYGNLVPNTYVQKVVGYPLSLRLENGWAFLSQFLEQNYLLLLLLFLAALSKKRVAFLNLASASIVLSYQLYVGGDPWVYWRQLLPIYVLAAFSLLLIFGRLNERYGPVGASQPPAAIVGALSALIIGGPLISFAFEAYSARHLLLLWRQFLPNAALITFGVLLSLDYASSLSRVRRLVTAPTRMAHLLIYAGVVVLWVLFAEQQFVTGDQLWLYFLRFAPLLATAALLIPITARQVSAPSEADVHWRGDVARLLIVIATVGAIVAGNQRFQPELFLKPYSFSEQAFLIDKAVLERQLFGPGKSHHVVWAGTYPYYVEGEVIDSLGKSDKEIARLPIDQAVAWRGMRGVTGHAKYDFRQTILQRKPDIIVDFLKWGRQDLSRDVEGSYTLIQSGQTSLCVRNELAAGAKALAHGSCPSIMLDCR